MSVHSSRVPEGRSAEIALRSRVPRPAGGAGGALTLDRIQREVLPILPELYTLAQAILRSRDLAGDAVQEVLLRLWREGRLPAEPRRALRFLVARRALHELRSRRRRHDHENLACSGDPCICSEPGPEERAVLKERLTLTRAALRALADEQRLALELYAVEGLGYGEIAERLHVPIGTVRSRLNRARSTLASSRGGRRLRDELGDDSGGPSVRDRGDP